MRPVHLLIIDPQYDFCNPAGALYVQGADLDMNRLATFIERNMKKIQKISVTLDSHNLLDIAHPIFWTNSAGKNPNPFTIISVDDVKTRVWFPKIPSLYKRALEYVEKLAANKRYPLCIWPPHCLIGSEGYQVVKEVHVALQTWVTEHTATINYVAKGANPFTEHYSAVQADVPDPKDPGTQINAGLIRSLEEADTILVAGEAGSHCLANTVRDIADNFGDPKYVKKITLLEDATSPVPGFEKFQTDFVKDMTARGMNIAKTTDWMV